MTDDKKNIPEAASPAEAHVPTVENAAVPEQPAPEPVLTDAEAVMLEHEGQAALFEMGEAVPDPADAVTHAEVEEPAAPEAPKAKKEQAHSLAPSKDDPAPAHSGKVVDFAAARDEAAKPSRGRPPKKGKVAPDSRLPPARAAFFMAGALTPEKRRNICSFSLLPSPLCRPLWLPSALALACGAWSICWRAMARTTPALMLMYGREAQSKTRIASPATIPKQGNHKAFPPLFRRIILWYNLKYRAVRKALV